MEKHKFASISLTVQDNSNSNSNSTFIALNLRQKTDSKAHHTKTLFNIQKPETLQGSAPRIDRVIWLKFSTHRVSKKSTLGNSSYSIKLKSVKFLKFHPPSSILSEIENVGYLKNL